MSENKDKASPERPEAGPDNDASPRQQRIGSILTRLMQAEQFSARRPAAEATAGPGLTSLGVPLLRRDDGRFVIDLSQVRVFAGLPGLVRQLVGEFATQAHATRRDVLAQVAVDRQAAPELAALGVEWVALYARSHLARWLAGCQDHLARRVRQVFVAIQSERWGGALFPEAFAREAACHAQAEPPALLFPAAAAEETLLLIAEYDSQARFLRLTAEDGSESRLHLKRIPHRVVMEPQGSAGQLDLVRAAENIFLGIHRQCQNQQSEYVELPDRQPALFELLLAAGLPDLTLLTFRWSLEEVYPLLMENERQVLELVCKVLHLFEDPGVMAVLSQGHLLEMIASGHRAFLDLSRAGACLNVSLQQQRKPANIEVHLAAMPVLARCAAEAPQGFEGFRILLIHHATSEILGLLKALETLRCEHLRTVFIKYKGLVPDEHLEALFTLNQTRFAGHALQKVQMRDSVEGAYLLGRQYSPVAGLESVENRLRRQGITYIEAMRTLAFPLFFAEARQARRAGQQLLLVEDGGYVAPLLNRFCLDGLTLGQALTACAILPDDAADWGDAKRVRHARRR